MNLTTPKALILTLPSPSRRSPPRSARLRRSPLPPPRSRRRLMRRLRALLRTSLLVTCRGTSTRSGSARSSRASVSFLVFASSPTATLVAPAVSVMSSTSTRPTLPRLTTPRRTPRLMVARSTSTTLLAAQPTTTTTRTAPRLALGTSVTKPALRATPCLSATSPSVPTRTRSRSSSVNPVPSLESVCPRTPSRGAPRASVTCSSPQLMRLARPSTTSTALS